MSDNYSEDEWDKSDKKPVRDTKSAKSKDSKNVKFKANEETQKKTVDVKDLPANLRKQTAQDELEQRKKFLTVDDIVSDSKSNKHVIYKFMKKGFQALTAEELACTMVNPTFSIDFKKNTLEDWNLNYQAKVVEKLQRCKFHMHWFIKQSSATGYDDQHENFMKLVEVGDLEKVFLYLRKNDMNQVLNAVDQKSKRSPLHIAAKHGHLHLIEFFLNKGANIEARDKMLKTPLHYSCELGHTLAVKMLMENGGDPFEKDNCGRTALHYAVYSGKTEILALLTMHTTDIVHMKDHAGRTALHHAVFMEANQVLMISKLLEYGADINALDSDRRTALHHAAEANKARVIPILIQKGAHTSLKEKLMNKTPLELAANDHIKELMIAYCSPQYMPDEKELTTDGKKKFIDTRVNKMGQITKEVNYDLEPPLKSSSSSLKKPKTAQSRTKRQEPIPEKLIIHEVVKEAPPCQTCESMKGIGPAREWLDQQEKFIPYNMKNYQERLIQLLRRIQKFGVESFVFQKKPYLYTGSWMEYVKNIDDLMLQINGVNPNEACMKLFNVLFPYPEPLPLGKGDESSLAGFFDGVTNVDKKKEQRDCLPEQLLENLNNKMSEATEDVMKNNDVETIQDLLDIRQEVMQLRSANNALEFQIQQKDELIAKLRGDSDELTRKASENAANDEQNMKLLNQNNKLQIQLNSLIEKNADLEDKVAQLMVKVKEYEGKAGSGLGDVQSKMAQQIDQLIEARDKWQSKYQMVNERNKTLRHKAGQVFLATLENAGGLGKNSVKNENGAAKLYIEDEEAIIRLIKEIELQDKGDLKARLKRISFSESGMIWQKNFISFIKDEVMMSDSDQIKLLRVAGFAALKTADKALKWELVLKNIEDRIAQSDKLKEDCIKKIAKLMTNQGITLETAMLYFDTDGSGTITRNEFNEAFKEMKVTLNEALLKNIFVILDKNGDNQIDLIEFEAVFGKYMRAGGPVQEVEAAELINSKIDAAAAKDLAKQMNNEIKKTNVYEDLRLESIAVDDVQKIEEQRIQAIKSGTLPEKVIGGELVLKLSQGQNFVELNGKNKFGFQYEMPRYDHSGRLVQPGYYNQMKMQNPETGGFRIKLKLPIMNLNMHLFQDMIKVSVFKCPESDDNFKTADKTFIGQIYIMWKECVEKEVDGESKWISFEEELRDPDQNCTVDLTGMFTGQVKWIKFGHKDSSYDEKGERREAPKAQKTFEDFKGKKVGQAGSLQVSPLQYNHPSELPLTSSYQVYIQLKNNSDEIVGETLTPPSNNELSIADSRVFKWAGAETVAITDQEEDVMLYLTMQTEQKGITQGKVIAKGIVNLNEALYSQSQKDAKGVQKIKIKVDLKLEGNPNQTSQMIVLLKYTPAVVPEQQTMKTEQFMETIKPQAPSKQEFVIPKDDEERPDEDEERPEEEEEEAPDDEIPEDMEDGDENNDEEEGRDNEEEDL